MTKITQVRQDGPHVGLPVPFHMPMPHSTMRTASSGMWPVGHLARHKVQGFLGLGRAELVAEKTGRHVARMESGLSDGRIVSGQLFTAFDEETKGTRIPAHFRQQSGSGSGGSEHKLVVNIACSEVPALPGPSERYYGILTSKGEIKSEFSCVSNATVPWPVWPAKCGCARSQAQQVERLQHKQHMHTHTENTTRCCESFK